MLRVCRRSFHEEKTRAEENEELRIEEDNEQEGGPGYGQMRRARA
jgi:hypothetical protein